MKNCSDCKCAKQLAEHEYKCAAEQYDIDNKTCFVPREVDDADVTAFKAVNRIARNSEQLSELLT